MNAALVKKWDQEAEIVVVGGGPAGLRAAITGANAGASVILLEKMESCTQCAAALSGGQLSFAGTEEQKAEGVVDSAELFTKDVIEGGDFGSDPKIVKAFMDRQLDTYHWLKQLGVEYLTLQLWPRNTIKRTFTVDPLEMMSIVQSTAAKSGAKLLFKCSAKRLVTNPEGGVIGVQAEGKDGIINIRTKKAVILATGGFGNSPDWMERCHRGYSKAITSAAPGCTGDGHLMALELGADLRGLPLVSLSIGLHEGGKSMDDWALLIVYGAIFVSKEGRRFNNEAGDYRKMGDILLEQPGQVAYQILDSKIRDMAKNAATATLPPTADKLLLQLQDDTVEGLARKAGINQEILRETVAKYNGYVESGSDSEYGRAGLVGNLGQLVKIDSPPFFAFPTVSHIPGTSLAGIVKDEKCRPKNVFGEIIPRLYVTGEMAIGFHGYRVGSSGASIVMSFIDGLIAAENAMAETSR